MSPGACAALQSQTPCSLLCHHPGRPPPARDIDFYPRHSPNGTLCPAPLTVHTKDGASRDTARHCGHRAAVPGLTPASSPLKPKSSGEKVGTETEGSAQSQGWVMGLDPTACSQPRGQPPLLSCRLWHFLLQLPSPSPQAQLNGTGTAQEQSDIAEAATAPGKTARLPPPFPITSPTHPKSLWDTALQLRSQTWSGATTHLPSGFWGSRRRALWRHTHQGVGHRRRPLTPSPMAPVPHCAHTHPHSHWASPRQKGCRSYCTGAR